MFSYLREEKILFSNDAFGQHLASTARFDDEYPEDIIMSEAKKYYANIVCIATLLVFSNLTMKQCNNSKKLFFKT